MKHLITKIQNRSRWKLNDLLFRLGIGQAGLSNRKGSRIIVYHGIDHLGRTDLNARFLSQKIFEEQIRFYKNHCNVVSLEEYFGSDFDPDKFNIAITFDDGYLNNLELALPILEKHEVPAAFFVTGILDSGYPCLWADYLDLATSIYNKPVEIEGVTYHKRRGEYYNPEGVRLKTVCKSHDWAFKKQIYTVFPNDFMKRKDLDVYWKLMDENQISELDASPFATVGSHGYVHDDLGAIDFAKASKNLELSKSWIEGVLNHPVTAFAYPDGSYSRQVSAKANALGFKEQLACDFFYPEDKTDKNLRERIVINPFISLENQMLAIYEGKY